jgi:hypothetical protein
MSETTYNTTEPPDPPGPVHPSVHYDASEVSVSLVVKSFIAAGVSLIIAGIVCALLYVKFENPQQKETYLIPMLRQRIRQLLPPEPRLQSIPGNSTYPEDDLRQMQRENDAVLNSYGWVDRESGIARIPIDEAMRLLVQQGQGPASDKSGSGSTAQRGGKEQR